MNTGDIDVSGMKNRRKKMTNNCWKSSYSCVCDKLPAGRYYIGDPCYAIGRPNSHWQKLCKVISDSAYTTTNETARWNKDKRKYLQAEMEDKDSCFIKAWIGNGGRRRRKSTTIPETLENYGLQITKPHSTKFYDVSISGTGGDGTYHDVNNPRVEYGVDAGLIGAIPIEIIPKNKRTYEDGKWNIFGGSIVTFKNELHCYYDGEYMHFGNADKHIAIDIEEEKHEQELEVEMEELRESNRPW